MNGGKGLQCKCVKEAITERWLQERRSTRLKWERHLSGGGQYGVEELYREARTTP